ncbi:MAG: glutamine synthetase III [Sphingobacteriales bacterium]|nr:glutamine synthetase III [Sphingobacteriales bacterium]
MRATFEARGYTAWDLTLSGFIMTVGSARNFMYPYYFCFVHGRSPSTIKCPFALATVFTARCRACLPTV